MRSACCCFHFDLVSFFHCFDPNDQTGHTGSIYSSAASFAALFSSATSFAVFFLQHKMLLNLCLFFGCLCFFAVVSSFIFISFLLPLLCCLFFFSFYTVSSLAVVLYSFFSLPYFLLSLLALSFLLPITSAASCAVVFCSVSSLAVIFFLSLLLLSYCLLSYFGLSFLLPLLVLSLLLSVLLLPLPLVSCFAPFAHPRHQLLFVCGIHPI